MVPSQGRSAPGRAPRRLPADRRRPAASAGLPPDGAEHGTPRTAPTPGRSRRAALRSLLRACQTGSDLAFAPLVRYAAARLAPATGTPPHFLYLLMTVEDKRFVLHGGIDPVAAARAALNNMLGRGGLQGASTITQQLFNVGREEAGLRRSRTLPVKWRQGLWAVRHQARHSKREILCAYLQRVYWGRSYHGLDDAARGYCGAVRAELSLAQSFFLVERLATPNVVRPRRIAALLRRRSIAPLFDRRIGARGELLALYERHFSAAARLRRELASGAAR